MAVTQKFTDLTAGTVASTDVYAAVDMTADASKKYTVSGLSNYIGTQVQNSAYSYAADSGAADVYAVALSPAATAYTAGMSILMKAANANTGACTVNVNSLGVKNIKLASGSDPAGNDILASGVYSLVYDGTSFQLINPS